MGSGMQTRDLPIWCNKAGLEFKLAKKVASLASPTPRFHATSTICEGFANYYYYQLLIKEKKIA